MSDSTSYFEQLTDHYKAVRARLNAGPPPPWRQPMLPMPEPEPQAPEPEPAPLTYQYTLSAARRIAQAALAPHGMTWTDAMGPSRKLPYTRARADVYVALRKHGWSLMKIAMFCGRDHTTVVNALHPKKDRKK
jgi:hypothetical protein